jgi:hypothetical protein
MSNNNIDRMLSMRAQTLSGNNNYGGTDCNNAEVEVQQNNYEDENSLKNLLLKPLNLSLLIGTIVILFILFILMVVYK